MYSEVNQIQTNRKLQNLDIATIEIIMNTFKNYLSNTKNEPDIESEILICIFGREIQVHGRKK